MHGLELCGWERPLPDIGHAMLCEHASYISRQISGQHKTEVSDLFSRRPPPASGNGVFTAICGNAPCSANATPPLASQIPVS